MYHDPIEKNYTKIPNDLLEHLAKANLCAYEGKIVFSIIRKTYGYQNAKKENWQFDYISHSQIMEMTGIPKKQNVNKYLTRLKKRRIILEFPGRRIGINPKYNEWVMSPKDINGNTGRLQESLDEVTGVIRISDKSNITREPQKNKIKENPKKALIHSKAIEQKKRQDKEFLKRKTGAMSLEEIINNPNFL